MYAIAWDFVAPNASLTVFVDRFESFADAIAIAESSHNDPEDDCHLVGYQIVFLEDEGED